MAARPKIEVPLTPADKAAEIAAWVALAALWVLTIWYLYRLPDTIPVHFDGDGMPNRYDEKSSLVILPLVATVLFAGLSAITSAVSKHPHTMNYPITITPANALGQYRAGIRMGRSLKIGVVLVFLMLVFQTAQVATGQAASLGAWPLPVGLALVLGLPGLWYWATVANAQK